MKTWSCPSIGGSREPHDGAAELGILIGDDRSRAEAEKGWRFRQTFEGLDLESGAPHCANLPGVP
jgi:hypothetical protein